MYRTPDSGAFTFLAPPLQARMRDVVIEAGTQARGDLALDAKQGIKHESLGRGRVEQREISG
jgi:hypothetical protein